MTSLKIKQANLTVPTPFRPSFCENCFHIALFNPPQFLDQAASEAPVRRPSAHIILLWYDTALPTKWNRHWTWIENPKHGGAAGSHDAPTPYPKFITCHGTTRVTGRVHKSLQETFGSHLLNLVYCHRVRQERSCSVTSVDKEQSRSQSRHWRQPKACSQDTFYQENIQNGLQVPAVELIHYSGAKSINANTKKIPW